MSRHLCALRGDLHGDHLSPCEVIGRLLTPFPVLCIASLWLIYFITGSLHLYSLSRFSLIPISLPSDNRQFVLCSSASASVLFCGLVWF